MEGVHITPCTGCWPAFLLRKITSLLALNLHVVRVLDVLDLVNQVLLLLHLFVLFELLTHRVVEHHLHLLSQLLRLRERVRAILHRTGLAVVFLLNPRSAALGPTATRRSEVVVPLRAAATVEATRGLRSTLPLHWHDLVLAPGRVPELLQNLALHHGEVLGVVSRLRLAKFVAAAEARLATTLVEDVLLPE